MAFRMGGLFIQAQVENGAGTFALEAHNSFVNSLNSVSVTMYAGGSSEIEINVGPTFPEAVNIIESGFLGFGFPIQSSGVQSVAQNIAGGVASAPGGGSSGGNSNKSASLSVRFGYGDIGAREDVAKTPWIQGTIQAPAISFGEEIDINLKAASFGISLASVDTTDAFEEEPLSSIVEKIVGQVGGTVEFTTQASARASSILMTRNQNDNSKAFLNQILTEHNFKFWESGGTAKNPTPVLMVDDLAGISNGEVKFTIRMYGQINVSEKIYPMESFDTDITHIFVAGGFFGSKTTNLRTEDKEVIKEKQDIGTFKKNIKDSGNTIAGEHRPGKPTKGGPTDGPTTISDESMAGKRYMTTVIEENDKEPNEIVKSQTHDDIAGALNVTVTCPLIPEAVPNSLVKVEIYTGNPGNPIFRTISGVYRIKVVRHTVSDSGGTTEMELYRGIGNVSQASAGVQGVQTTQLSTADVVNVNIGTFRGGVIS